MAKEATATSTKAPTITISFPESEDRSLHQAIIDGAKGERRTPSVYALLKLREAFNK